MHDLYKILGIQPGASKEEVKKAYRIKALKYHPDKNTDPASKEHFVKIHTAYNILMNYEDSINENHNNIELDLLIKKYIEKLSPGLGSWYDNFVKIFYKNPEEYKDDINHLNITNIYNKIRETVIDNELDDLFDMSHDFDHSELNIETTLTATIEDKYLERYAKVKIKRQTKPPYEGLIPLNENEVVIEDEGESKGNVNGDIIIRVKTLPHEYMSILNNDIIIEEELDLYKYLYGGHIKIKFFDEDINLTFKNFVHDIPVFKIEGKGLNINGEQGDLFINFKIKDLESLKSDIKTLSYKDQE